MNFSFFTFFFNFLHKPFDIHEDSNPYKKRGIETRDKDEE